MKVYCYFHNDDLDGWSSSAVVKRKHPDAEFYGYNYGPDLPLVEGYDIVYMVDCSTTSENMKKLMEKNKKFVWIDHHTKKILATYKDLGEDIPGLRDIDSKHSACVLTWKYLFPDDTSIPRVLSLIEDLDIWKWKKTFTDEVNTALFIDHSEDRNYLIYIMNQENWYEEWPKIKSTGISYIKMRKHQIQSLIKLMKIKTFHGYKTAIVNSPIHTSFLGNEILEQNRDIAVALIWYNKGNDMRVSLRSRDVDVSKIAHEYGGGGHKHASGFRLRMNENAAQAVFI